MDRVFISDFDKMCREELMILVFEAYYPNNKLEYNDNFLRSCIEQSDFMREIYNDDSVNCFKFDEEFGVGTFQDLVESIRENKSEKVDIIDSLMNMEIN